MQPKPSYPHSRVIYWYVTGTRVGKVQGTAATPPVPLRRTTTGASPKPAMHPWLHSYLIKFFDVILGTRIAAPTREEPVMKIPLTKAEPGAAIMF